MKSEEIAEEILRCGTFTSSRSQGPGGQSVNTTDSKIQLSIDIGELAGLSELQRERVRKNLDLRRTREGLFYIQIQNERSQLRNKELAVKIMTEKITAALKPKKRRRPTRPTKASRRKRLDNKRHRGHKKALRRSVGDEER